MSIDYNEYFGRYAGLVNDDSLTEAMEKNHRAFMALAATIDEERSTYRYGDDKWSIKELVAHVIDTERIFAYRALRFARNDSTALSGFDENHFAAFAGADERAFKDLVEEFDYTRRSSMALYKSFDEEMLQRSGKANGITFDVTLLGYLIAGHCHHHMNVLRERYL